MLKQSPGEVDNSGPRFQYCELGDEVGRNLGTSRENYFPGRLLAIYVAARVPKEQPKEYRKFGELLALQGELVQKSAKLSNTKQMSICWVLVPQSACGQEWYNATTG